jgi:hypothetical protein
MVNDLTLILLMWRKLTPNNASKWQMGFNSAFKGLIIVDGWYEDELASPYSGEQGLSQVI